VPTTIKSAPEPRASSTIVLAGSPISLDRAHLKALAGNERLRLLERLVTRLHVLRIEGRTSRPHPDFGINGTAATTISSAPGSAIAVARCPSS
jgi:hypothetical protein